MEKSELALSGLSIIYSDCFDIEKDVNIILSELNDYDWKKASYKDTVKDFSSFTARLWKVHPFREGNTRTIITFCNQFIESRGYNIDSTLLADNSSYVRTALVAANAIFEDLGDKRKPEYLERIIGDALKPKELTDSKENLILKKLNKKSNEDKKTGE